MGKGGSVIKGAEMPGIRLRRPKSEPGCVPGSGGRCFMVGMERIEPCAVEGADDTREGDWEEAPH